MRIPQRFAALVGASKPSGQRQAEWKRVLEHALFGFVPVAASVALLVLQIKTHAVAVDFRTAYWPAGSRLLHGLNTYAVTRQQILGGVAFVYPALSAVVFAPFSLISTGIAQYVYMLICVACIPAVLYALNVKDWRVYGMALLWFPVFSSWQTANVTLPLTLAVALAWRHRARPLVAGLLTAAAISIKPFMWPLGLWLLATRRWRAAAWALATGLAINLLAWGIVGFAEIHVYLRLSSEVTTALWHGGYSMMAVAHHLGFARSVGEGLLFATSALTAAALVYVGLSRHREQGALVLAVLLMLLASPLLWSHYFTLLLIPMAISRPRLSPAWTIGLLMWPMPPRLSVLGWELALAWVLTGLCVGLALVDRPDAVESRHERRPQLPQLA